MIVATILYLLGIAAAILFVSDERPAWSPGQYLLFGMIWPFIGAVTIFIGAMQCTHYLFRGEWYD